VKRNSKKYKKQLKGPYQRRIAKNTMDSQELRKILEKKEDDVISGLAAENPYCPIDLLIDILRTKGDSLLAQSAACNPSCPSEILLEVLKRGDNDLVSQYAARNSNCPLEAIKEVLSRGKDDNVSQIASNNKNCTLFSKIKWLRSIGKIYDPKNPKKIIKKKIKNKK
jgi:hypothetical protein